MAPPEAGAGRRADSPGVTATRGVPPGRVARHHLWLALAILLVVLGAAVFGG